MVAMHHTGKPAYVITPAGKRAGGLVRELRTRQGLSTTDLSFAILAAGLGSVSPRTLRRIEKGVTPRVRVQYAVARYFDREVPQVWPTPGRSASVSVKAPSAVAA